VTQTSPQLIKSYTSKGLKTVRVDVFGVGGGQVGSATSLIEVQ